MLVPKEVLDGQEYSIEEFHGKYSAFFVKPWDFYRDFKENGCKCHCNHSLLGLKP